MPPYARSHEETWPNSGRLRRTLPADGSSLSDCRLVTNALDGAEPGPAPYAPHDSHRFPRCI